MSVTRSVELSLSPEPELLRAVRLVISSIAADLGYSFEDMEDLKLAVQEACTTRLSLGLAQEALHVVVRFGAGRDLVVEVSGDTPGGGPIEDEEAQWGLDLAGALVDSLEVTEVGGIEVLRLTKRGGGAA